MLLSLWAQLSAASFGRSCYALTFIVLFANGLPVNAEAFQRSGFTFLVPNHSSKNDLVPPTVKFIGLPRLPRVSGTFDVVVNASDNVGLNRIELYLDRNLIDSISLASVPTATVTFSRYSGLDANGKHMLIAKAIDSNNNAKTASLVFVTRNNAVPPGNRIAILPNLNYQTMVGWQASGDTGIIERIVTAPRYTNAILDACVELGINRVRVGLHSGAAENSTDYYQLFLNNGQDAVNNTTPIQWANVRANWYRPVNDNADPNVINPNGFKWALLDAQIEKIIVPMKQKLAARGESLWWQVTYIHFSTASQLHVDTPEEYGELILAAWNHINSRFGFLPNGLEIFLEPDNVAADVTPVELSAMIAAARNRLVAAGYPTPHITAPSTVVGPNAGAYYNAILTANPTAASYVDEISYHRYLGNMDPAALMSLRTIAERDGKRTAMTEYGGATFQHLFNDLKYGKVSAWEQYALGFLNNDDGYQYFTVSGSGPYVINIGSQTKFLRQFMKFIRAGAVMKGVWNSSPDFEGLPFRNSNGTFAVPIKANTAGIVNVENLPAGTYGIKYTTSASFDVDLPNQTIPAGGVVTFNMPAAGVVTVYDITYR